MIAGMVSCLPKPDPSDLKGEDCNSNFVIEEEVKGSLFISDATALPEKFTLQLTACIRPQALIETKLASVRWAISRNIEKLKKFIDEINPDNINQSTTDQSTNLSHHDTVTVAKTDANGCIHWTEEYDYAYNKQSQWILLDRHIGGITKEYSGTCKIPLVVNPWLQLPSYSNIRVADYKYHKEHNTLKNRVVENESGPAFLKRKKEEELKNKVDIIIDDLELHMGGSTPISGTRILHENTIKAELKYIIRDIHGNLQSNNNHIRSGQFKIEPHLLIEISDIETDKENKEIKKIEYIKMNENNNTSIDTEFKNHKLTSDPFEWKIPYEIDKPEAIALYLKVTPTGETAKRVNPFEGVYYLGPKYQDVISKNTHSLHLNAILASQKYLQLSNNHDTGLFTPRSEIYKHPNQCFEEIGRNNKSVISCISTTKTAVLNNGELRRGFRKAGWTVKKMNLRFFQMKRENWLTREISTIAETTIHDHLHVKNISADEINIDITDLSTGKTIQNVEITDGNGNISFNIPTKQQWYNRQRYFLKVIRFTSKTKELQTQKLVAINPWDYGFTHGFEVNHPKQIRTTCLEGGNDNKEASKLLNKDINDLTNKDIETIHKIFCHNNPHLVDEPLIVGHWKNVFKIFKTALTDVLRKSILDPEEHFLKKFTSVKEKAKIPTSHVHLFRSINKYPTYLIDDSLNREIYYNVRFKLSPRVVRHDDIAIGQQNKGPLRDGVYIFQMAILKNDQEKSNGNESAAQSKEEFSQQILNTNHAGTVSLFSCPMENPKCVKKEDYILPPTKIPIIIRDGMVKTDVRIPIKREYLLFANSKNLLVFQILPADPSSIVCKNKDTNTECTMDKQKDKLSYEAAFDWNETAKKIQPAKPDDYEMFFFTYKTPFIPSLWANWNITQELDINFDELKKQYNLLKTNENFNNSENSLILQIKNSSDEYSKEANNIPVPHEQFILKLKEMSAENKFRKFFISSHIDEAIKQDNQDKIKDALNTITEQLIEYRREIEQSSEMTADQRNTELKRIAQLLKDIENQSQDPSSLVAPLTKKPKNLEEAIEAQNQHQQVFDKTNSTSTSSAVCAEVNIGEKNYPVGKGGNDSCLTQMKKKEEDLTHKHVSRFASTHTLCTMNTNANEQLPRHCGYDLSHTQGSFLEQLNRHIKTINKISKEIHKNKKQRLGQQDTFKHKQEEEEEKKVTSPTAMKDSFQQDTASHSIYLASKLDTMPELKELNTMDLKRIITSGIDNNTINDLKTGSFLHSLCGFWFSEFLSDKYVTSDLLLDGFRNIVKNTFYYKLRGVTRPPEEDNNKKMKKIRNTLNELEILYYKYLREQTLEGQIDDLHKWANDPEKYGFDTGLLQDMHSKFENLAQQKVLDNVPPFPQRKSENTDNDFHLEHYLAEAVNVYKRPYHSFNFTQWQNILHPVKKCIMNPTHFFGFEKKTIVGKIGNTKYDDVRGQQTTITINEDFLMNTQRDQGSNQQTEIGLTSNISLLAIPLIGLTALTGGAGLALGIPILAKLGGLGGAGVAAGTILGLTGALGNINYSYRAYEGTGKRRLFSLRVSQGVELISETTPVNIQLSSYHDCLVIRPRFSAFQSPRGDQYEHIWNTDNPAIISIYKKMGMLLCTKGKTHGKRITETYHYIYPKYPINGITMDPSSHRNKPFAISLRGRKAYKKFIHNLSCYVTKNIQQMKERKPCRDTRTKYEYLLRKNIEFAKDLKKGFDVPKLFHLTGDLPGVYSKYTEPPERELEDVTFSDDMLNWLSKNPFLDKNVENIVRKEP